MNDNRILFLFNALPPSKRSGVFSECLSWHTVRRIYRALLEGQNEVYTLNLRSPEQLAGALKRLPTPSLAFILAEGLLEQPRTLYDGSGAALVRSLLGQYGIPCSHSPVASMEICRHKSLTYIRLASRGIPVPPHQLLDPSQTNLFAQAKKAAKELGFPLFVKPNGGGNSLGIDRDSLVPNYHQLHNKIQAILNTLGEVPVLAEQYLPGPEYTVGIIGPNPLYVLPPLAFPAGVIRSLEVKKESKTSPPAVIGLKDRHYELLGSLALKTFRAVNACDVLRIDLREDAAGNLYVIDVNGTPSLNPTASLILMAEYLNISYTQIINLILYYSLTRHGLKPSARMQELLIKPFSLLEPYGWEVENIPAFSFQS
ncbi:MAG: D-alanine-D-alanine ligase [Clostridia bacterium]|nr:D-alanine-D-alanine ligase [Clostridia bacterium]